MYPSDIVGIACRALKLTILSHASPILPGASEFIQGIEIHVIIMVPNSIENVYSGNFIHRRDVMFDPYFVIIIPIPVPGHIPQCHPIDRTI